MSLLSSQTLIRILSTFHLATSYYLLTTPQTLATHGVVLMMARAMSLPDASTSSAAFGAPNAPTSLAALFLGLLAITDFVSAGMADLAFHEHWGVQAPLRIAVLFALEGWIYATGPVDVWRSGVGGGWGALKNGMVFTWGFIELIIMFWIFLKLREERQNVHEREAKKQIEKEQQRLR